MVRAITNKKVSILRGLLNRKRTNKADNKMFTDDFINKQVTLSRSLIPKDCR